MPICCEAMNNTTPPRRCIAANTFCVAKNRSATRPTKNGERIAPIAVVPAATPDDIERRFFTVKSATGTKLPLNFPIPITVGKKDFQKKIKQDDDDFGFKTTTVAPHTTVAGYLFYDISDVDDPALKNATLELRKVRFATSNKALDSFEIPLQPNPKSTDKPKAKP